MRGTAAGILLLTAGAGLRLFGLGWYDLSGDEAYHWLWSQHLALAYYDEPGAIAWLTAASAAAFGSSEAGLRVGASLVGIVAWLAFGALAWLLRCRRAAIIALLFGLACPPLLMAARRDTAEPLVELAALAAVTFAVLADRRPRWLLAAGAALGLGLWSRYTIAPVVLGLAIHVAIRRRSNARLTLVATGLMVVGLLPTLVYVLTHGPGGLELRVLHVGGGLGAAPLPVRALHLAETLGWPAIPILVAGLVPARDGQAAAWWPGIATLAVFLAAAGDSPRDVVPGLLPTLALGIVRIEGRLNAVEVPARAGALAGLALIGAEGILGVTTLATALGVAGLPSARLQTRDLEARYWDALGPALAQMAGGRVVQTVDPDLAGLVTYYSGVTATTSYPGYHDIPQRLSGPRMLISSYPWAGVAPAARLIAGTGPACRSILIAPTADLPSDYLDLLGRGQLSSPIPGCTVQTRIAGHGFQLSASAGPGAGKTSSLQKGAYDSQVGEGWGVGVPIASYADGQVVSGAATLVLRAGQAPEKVYALDRIDRSHRPLAIFLPIAPRGTVAFSYGPDGTVTADPHLDAVGLRSVTALNETSGAQAQGPAWKATPTGGCVREPGGGLCAWGATAHVGHELAPPYLDWAGVDLDLAPDRASSYRVAFHADLSIPAPAPVLSSPAYKDGLIAYGEWGAGGRLWLIDSNGSPLPGWPIAYPPGGVFGSPAMDGSGTDLRVVVGDNQGLVHALDRTGHELPGWPVDLGYKVWTSPTILPDGDVVVGDRNQVHLLDPQGHELPGWPQPMDGWPIATPAYDHGLISISTLLIGNQRRGWLYEWTVEGHPVPGFPVQLADDTDSSPTPLPDGSTLVADSSGDFWRVSPAGTARRLPSKASQPVEASFTVAGDLAVIGSWDHHLRGWNLADDRLAFDVTAGNQIISSVAACSIDGEQIDLLAGSKDGGLYAWDSRGGRLAGYPIPLGDRSFSSPLVVDLDGDGYADVVIGAANGLHIVRDVGPLGSCPWPMFRQNPAHTGAR